MHAARTLSTHTGANINQIVFAQRHDLFVLIIFIGVIVVVGKTKTETKKRDSVGLCIFPRFRLFRWCRVVYVEFIFRSRALVTT